ncbi:MAG: response regulator [Peptococcaceae bacterium]|jgi:putative two-component system response regulator|nr:response regulator [Peptococcaceae bacterium]
MIMEGKDRVLIVDDMEINRVILREILSQDYIVMEAENGYEAMDILFGADQYGMPQAVLLDIMMPGIDGFEVLSVMKGNPLTQQIPVIIITAADAMIHEFRGLKEGAVDYISKPFDPDIVKARVDNHIELLRYRTKLEMMVEKKSHDMLQVHRQMLETMANIIEYRSLESGTHIRRTNELMRVLVVGMLENSLFSKDLIDLDYSVMIDAVIMHDIGKVAIPDSILLKPGRLTQEEFEVIKTHTVIGSHIIDGIFSNLANDDLYLRHCREICRSHHEYWNGNGYPDGLTGEEIPLSARILSVLDVYDALVSERCYKVAVPHDKAVEIIKEGAGTQFDPHIIKTFLQIQDRFNLVEQANHAV